MDNYVHVGNIIEQERLKRQEQISKGISSDVFDHIEKAHSNDFSQVEVTTDDNLTRFANDISQLNKAETELLLHKLQRQINADSKSQLLKSFRSIALSHIDAIEKGIYADTVENRKLGRVGQEWERSKNRKALSIANALKNEFIKHTLPINGNGDAFHPDVTEVLKQNWDNPDVKAVFKKHGFNSIKEAKEWSESGALAKNNPSYQQLRSHYKKGRMLLKEALQVIPGEKFLSQKEKLDEYEKNYNRFNPKPVMGEKEKKQFIKQALAGTIDAKYTDRIISANADEPSVKKVLKKYGLNNINDFFEWNNYDLYDEAYVKMLRAIPAEKFIKKVQNSKKKLKSGGLPEIKYNPEFDNGLPSNKQRRKKPAVPKWMKVVNKITRQ